MARLPSIEEQAQTRAALRELERDLDSNKQSLTETRSTGLAEAQKKANELYAIAQTESRGAALDATILNKVATLGAEQAGNLEKKSEGYVRNLRQKFSLGGSGTPRINWQRLGDAVENAGIYTHVPAVTFLLGDFVAPEPKQRQERKRKERAPSEPMQTAATVQVSQLQEAPEDRAQVSRMKVLRQTIKEHAKKDPDGRVNLFRLVLHPTSFSQTVENFFDLSFIVKDGFAEIVSTDGAAFVRPRTPPDAQAYSSGLIKRQNIVTLDYDIWKKLCARWLPNGALPILPSRGGGRDID